MFNYPMHHDGVPILGWTRRRRWPLSLLCLGLGLASPWVRAAAPLLATGRTLDRQVHPTSGPETNGPGAPTPRTTTEPAPPRVASFSSREAGASAAHAADRGPDSTDPISLAKKSIAACQERYRQIDDYTCVFVKRERIDGRLTQPHKMEMKARTNPNSLYFRFQQPNQGREAIYVQGRNNGRVLAHDVGLGKFLAGTMHLDPRGSRAMEENRHPVTEAGIGALIDSVARHWAVELTPGESVITFQHNVRIGDSTCTRIESTHPQHGSNFLFHKVNLYVDNAHGVPIRFEAFDWPKHAGVAPELVEEYFFQGLKTNVGLCDRDFDPANEQYSFGRL